MAKVRCSPSATSINRARRQSVAKHRAKSSASAGNAATFQSKWNGKAGLIADSLLKITDERAVRTRHQTAKKAYEKLRPSAKRNVEEAVPGLGKVLSKHAAV